MKFKSSAALLACVFLLTCSQDAHAFSLRLKKKSSGSQTPAVKPSKPNKNIRVTETPDYIVLFFLTGVNEKRAGGDGVEKKFLELSYKFSIRLDEPSQLFGGTGGWAKIRFLDSEGYSLAEDKVPFSELLRGKEYYGFAWIAESKAGFLRGADIHMLKPDEIPPPAPVVLPVQEVPPSPAVPEKVTSTAAAVSVSPSPKTESAPGGTMASEGKPEAVKGALPESASEAAAVAIPKPQVSVSVTEQPNGVVSEVITSEPRPLPKPEPAKLSPGIQKSPAAQGSGLDLPAAAPTKPEPSGSPEPNAAEPPAKPGQEGLNRGGVTNDDVQGVIDEFNKKVPTAIEESKPEEAKSEEEEAAANAA